VARSSSNEERVFLAFRQVIAAVVLFNDQVALRTGIGLTDSQFLHLLAVHGPMSPSELARASGLGSGTVTGVVNRLEELGFVHRERHPSDRRRVTVVADQAKVDLELAPHFASQSAYLAKVIERFDQGQLATIADFLEALLTNDP
jgi:DNA-binding MarR family transcriptional regulator